MNLTRHPRSLLFPNALQACGKLAQLSERALQFLFRPLAPGDVAVDRITRNLPAGNRDGHTDHGSVQTAAILALADNLRLHTLSLGHQVRVSLSRTSRFFGYNQVVQAMAQDLLRSVTKDPSELPVHP